MNPADLRRFLDEDLGEAGDVTTRAIGGSARVGARLVARERAVLAGAEEAAQVFVHLGAECTRLAADGDVLAPGASALGVSGPAASVLAGERLALNLVMRMSGIATSTRELADAVRGVNPACRVAATRKTTPGFRAYEKKAVVLGGGDPHRAGLSDAFLVKDNHRALLPDVAEAVRRCRALSPGLLVEVEAETLEEALAAAGAGADWLLLDNRSPEEFARWAEKIRERFPGVRLEASGGITPETVAAYAAHADRISLGWLTHSARARDFGLDFDAPAASQAPAAGGARRLRDLHQ